MEKALVPDHATLVRTYIEAVGERRLEDVAECLHQDLAFDGPGLESLRGSDAYVAALRRLSPIIARNEVRHIYVDEVGACVLYDFVTETPVGPVASVERLTIEDGRIRSIWLLFDKGRWPEVVERLEELASEGR
jgi:limonene-1,2-epoxide hydrolase